MTRDHSPRGRECWSFSACALSRSPSPRCCSFAGTPERREAAVRRAHRTLTFSRPRSRMRLGRLIVLAFVVLLAPPVYSYVTTMMKPSSLPLWPRSVEWLRAHHGSWLVDNVEHYYYSWPGPDKGGPELKLLPPVGIGRADVARGRSTPAQHVAAWPPRIKPVFVHPLAGEGAWNWTGPFVRGRPPVLV